MNNQKRLYKTKENAMLGGVCAGIAEYFNIDATIIRLLFVLLILGVGSGLLIYLVCWIVFPDKATVMNHNMYNNMNQNMNDNMYNDMNSTMNQNINSNSNQNMNYNINPDGEKYVNNDITERHD